MRSTRPVPEPGLALRVEPGDPTVRALARDPHRPGDMRDRHALITDTAHQHAPAMERQTSVTVRHEDLRLVKTAISTAPGVFSLRQPNVTNVQAEYN